MSCVERETKLNTCTCFVDAYVQKRPVVCVRVVCRPLKCEAVVYVHVHVHVIGKCEAITSFDRVNSSGDENDVLFLSSYGATPESSTVDSH